jgi:hypothetical protein
MVSESESRNAGRGEPELKIMGARLIVADNPNRAPHTQFLLVAYNRQFH